MPLAFYLTIEFPNYKIDPRLSGNSRGSAYLKRQAQRQAKGDGEKLCFAALNEKGVDAREFLTHNYRFFIPAALPLRLVCRRFYDGKNKIMDKENCLMGFKYYIDGIARALGINDRDFDLQLEQIRGNQKLEIEITPAWAVN